MRTPGSNIPVLLVTLSICALGSGPVLPESQPGSLMIIGGVLRYDNQAVWRRIVGLAGAETAEMVVFPTASGRPKIYGGFAVRALKKYGAFVEFMPVAIQPNEFEVTYQEAIKDPILIEKVREATGVFFVGGAPHRIVKALFTGAGASHAMAHAIREVYHNGGVIAGGILGRAVVDTRIDPLQAMRAGLEQDKQILQGLDLIRSGWLVDQNVFSHGRFATMLVAMQKLGYKYALGVGVNTAVVITNDRDAQVIGDNGVLVVDLSLAHHDSDIRGFNLRDARLTYLDNGDRINLQTLKTTPHTDKLEGFEIHPGTKDHQPTFEGDAVYLDVLAPSALKNLMFRVLDGVSHEAIGFTFADNTDEDAPGFQFRLYRGPDSVGWMSTFGIYTAVNIYLDVTSITRKAALEKKGEANR